MSVVFVDTVGRGWTPPAGTQLREFEDNFNRADQTTLGTDWGVAWSYADYPYGDTIVTRPTPYDAALCPKIENGKCVWFQHGRNTSFGPGWGFTCVWPWKLAWLSQGKFDHYAEVTVHYKNPTLVSGAEACVVMTQASGSLYPDTYLEPYGPAGFAGQYGNYGVGGTIVYNIFGANPSATPTGLRGHSGMNYLIIGNSTLPGADLPYTLRGEARWTGTSWNLRSFVNGTFDNEVNDSRLLQGLPGFCVFVNPEPIITTYDPSRLVEITRFKGGLLR